VSNQRMIIRNGFIVSLDPELGQLPGGDILVEDGKIVSVGRDLDAGDAEVVDANGMIVIPGFVDTHRHTWQTPVRGVLPCCTLDAYFTDLLGKIALNYRPEDAGIRAVYAHGVPGDAAWWAYSENKHPEDVRRLRDQYFSSEDQLLTLALATRAPGNVTPETAKHDWELARDIGARISVHVGMRLTGIHVNHVLGMNELGIMGPDTTYIHCTDSTDEELDLIASTGGTASVSAYVELLMGHGRPPTGRLLARGVRPTLSVDVVSSVPGDMFTQMRTALVYERILAFTDSPDEPFAPTLTHNDVLEFATIDGAGACGLGDKIGTIAPGKQADLVFIRTDQVNVVPLIDPVTTVVVCADTSNIDSVFVAGKPVKRNGELVGVDLARLTSQLESSRDHLLGKADMLPDWLGSEAAATV
jgi:5-methylthioadenosine/S-adenosylhomocysteine deaminase